uniref:Uncharacterized protein n=1 Tax=Anguilla anguilla TaxID=7936 RepID=A0A0E9TRS2_ANGAN
MNVCTKLPTFCLSLCPSKVLVALSPWIHLYTRSGE